MSSWFRTYGYAEVFDDLLIGAYPTDAGDVAMLKWAGVDRVLNLVEDSEYQPGSRAEVIDAFAAAGIEEQRLQLIDFGELPAESLEAAVETVNRLLDEGAHVYVHCRAGWQRSAAVAAGVVALRTGLEIDEALDYVRDRKPSADPLPHQREDLKRWWLGRAAPAAEEPGGPEG
jgi:protein-tyrosine phosphatase